MANTATLKPSKPHNPAAIAATAKPSFPSPAFAMLSHRGHVRHSNEDACAALPERGVFVVCDGMGGAANGEVASHLASEAFVHSLSQPRTSLARRIPPRSAAVPASPSRQDGAAPYPAGHPHARLEQAVRAANHAVYRHSRKSPSLHGMGTTLVAVLLENDPAPIWEGVRDRTSPTLWLAHVGDSRCYRLRQGALHPLTVDHSLVEEQIRAGVLSRVQAAASPIRNIITRAVGSQPTVEPEIAAHAVEHGDLYLLASDGLTRELDEAEVAQVLVDGLGAGRDLNAICKALIDEANRKGGGDNITVLLVSCL
jgi:serine/threonine protein phosphatase PrpC